MWEKRICNLKTLERKGWDKQEFKKSKGKGSATGVVMMCYNTTSSSLFFWKNMKKAVRLWKG